MKPGGIEQSTWDEETDLLVFGAGAAGMTAAFVAANEGLDVILCEKHSQIGGTTATSGGMIFAPGNEHSARMGKPDSIQAARTYLTTELREYANPTFVEAFLEAVPAVVSYLEKYSELKFSAPYPNPDYHFGPGASDGGRTLVPLPFDGRRLGKDFAMVRAPLDTLMVLGGMMIARREVGMLLNPLSSLPAARFAIGALSRYLLDRLKYRRGTRLLLGNALAASLFMSLRQQQVPVRVSSRLSELIVEDDRITGARVETEGKLRTIRARVGVVLATGGFAGSEKWRHDLGASLPVDHSLAFRDSCGEAFDAASAVGATINGDHASPVFWMPVSLHRTRQGKERMWMHGVLDRAKPGIIAVMDDGHRFVNEAGSYHDFTLAMCSRKNLVPRAHLICDSRFLKKYGMGMVQPRFPLHPYLKSGYLKTGQTIELLARSISLDPEQLAQTVETYNRDAKEGSDPAFGRGSTALNRHNGDPTHSPNPCVAPIQHGPFYAITTYPSILGTSAGIETDVNGRVLDSHGEAIAGLYACGNDMSSMMRGFYPGPGITLGPALAFAYRTALHAASQKA